MKLPTALKQLRKELNLKQNELAMLLHVNPTTVNRWEKGKMFPTYALRVMILNTAEEKGASNACIENLNDIFLGTSNSAETVNDLRRVELDIINEIANESATGILVISEENSTVLYVNRKMAEISETPIEKIGDMKGYELIKDKQELHCNCEKETRMSVDIMDRSYEVHSRKIEWRGERAQIKYFTEVTEK